MAEIRCFDCRQKYPETGFPYRCPECGGIYDYDPLPEFNQDKIRLDMPGYWRYMDFLGLPENAPVITLGEGTTPLLWVLNDAKKIGLKMESQNPTGSYKDRGTAVLISHLVAQGIKQVVEDSSGNAGASLAAYSAAAGIKSSIYVPSSASGAKRSQIEAYGAELIEVAGPRSQAAEAVKVKAAGGIPYASHAYMPFLIAGIATIGYELWEQMGCKTPGSIITPVGHGGLLLGIIRGFVALQRAGLVDRLPFWVGIQPEACEPLTHAFKFGLTCSSTIEINPTIAEGTSILKPSREKPLLQAMAGGRGLFHSIPEERILPAARDLSRHGIYVEPTSALVWAALENLYDDLPKPIVAILTGSGLKSLHH